MIVSSEDFATLVSKVVMMDSVLEPGVIFLALYMPGFFRRMSSSLLVVPVNALAIVND